MRFRAANRERLARSGDRARWVSEAGESQAYMNTGYAGVDLGGTNVTFALASPDGTMLETQSAPTNSHEGPEIVLRRIGDILQGLAGAAGLKLEAVGMGVPGRVDRTTGTTEFLPNLPTQWRGVPVAAQLGAALDAPVYLLNDCRAATLGELTFGRGRHVRDLVVFMLGTGIGGGVALDRKLRLGPIGAAGELGHQTILPDGPPCGCGSRGCLESLAGGPALTAEGVRLLRSGLAPRLHEIVRGDAGAVSPQTMGEAAREGDAAVRGAIERAGEYLGIGVANVITILHPELVVIGGGMAGLGDLLLDPVRAAVCRRVRMFPASTVAIELSTLADRAGLYGAVALALNRGQT
jgi:glucokinase